MIFDRHANLKYKYGSRHFWCRGYYVDTVGRNKKIIAEYIRQHRTIQAVRLELCGVALIFLDKNQCEIYNKNKKSRE